MARKKSRKKSRKTYRSRRGGSMLGAIDTTNLLGVVAGAVGAKMIDKILPDSLDPKIVAAGKIGLGIFMPNFVKSGKTKAMLQGVGSGFIAVGSMDLLTSLGVLSGVNDTDLLAVSLEGMNDLDVINGTDDLPTVNGDVEVLAGDVEILAGGDDFLEY